MNGCEALPPGANVHQLIEVAAVVCMLSQKNASARTAVIVPEKGTLLVPMKTNFTDIFEEYFVSWILQICKVNFAYS